MKIVDKRRQFGIPYSNINYGEIFKFSEHPEYLYMKTEAGCIILNSLGQTTLFPSTTYVQPVECEIHIIS